VHQTSQNILFDIERLQHIRNLELRSDLGQLIHQNRLLQLAREGPATTPQHIARFDEHAVTELSLRSCSKQVPL